MIPNRDKLNNIDPAQVVHPLYALVDKLQDFPAETQALAPAFLFMTMAKALGVDPQDVMVVAKNILAHPTEGQRDQFRALDLYVKHEVVQ